jgi:hypothetical protein
MVRVVPIVRSPAAGSCPDSPSLTVRGRPGSLRGPFGLVFLLCGLLARPALAGGVDVRSSIQGSVGLEQVSMPSASETSQQPTRPRASEGNKAAPLASPSPPPVQCPIPGLTSWLFSGLGPFLAKDLSGACASNIQKATALPKS